MAGRRGSIARIVVCAVAVISLTGAVGIFALGGSASAHAPNRSGPPWPLLDVSPAVYDSAAHFDLWLLLDGTTWSYAGGVWTNLTSTAGTPTNMEVDSRMVYDANDGLVVLYGGSVPRLPFPPLNDTWTYDGSRWVNETASVLGAPPPGGLGMMAYDSEDRVVVLYGETPIGQYHADSSTWVFDSLRWTNESVSGPRPITSESQPDLTGFTDDPSDGYVVFYSIFGGCSGPALCPILWTYAGGTWTNRSTTVSPLPELTLFDAFTYDTSTSEVVAVGGCQNTATYTCAETYGVFSYHAGSWTDITPGSGPAPREFASWVDDPSDDGVMVVGGCCWADFSGLSLMWQDIWIFAHGHWTERLPWAGGPPSPLENDGFWIAVGTIGVPALLGLLPARGRPSTQSRR